ncbi:hypothetical protein BD414DRAFT_497289 [Trametes punicea]|nr:hypothetical protein BD414DRAFT_497289 [Trametes punicea]
MLSYSKFATLAFLLLLVGVANAAPLTPQKRVVNTSLRLARDGDNLTQSTTVQTTNTIQTAVGPMVQTCTITLDPITGDNGEPLVRETKSCSVSMATSGNNASGSNGSNPSDGASSAVSASPSATDSQASATQTDGSASATPTDSNASAPASTTGAIGVNGESQIPGSALPTGATGSASASDSSQATATATASAAASASTGGGAVSPGGFSTIDASAVSTESVASASATSAPSGSGTAVGDAANTTPSSATSAADTAQSSAASFQLPGTKLSVLPIGLGVFGGISLIALIVVGLVTYERTKYRKAFRQRKLAESGAPMGYGGMAQAA